MMLVAGWALVDKPWAPLEVHAIKAALTALVLLAIGPTLRRVPAHQRCQPRRETPSLHST